MDHQRKQIPVQRLGENLRSIRLAKEMSIEAMAKQFGVSKLTLLKIEQGEGNPTLAVIWKIADALDIPISSLLSVDSDVEIARRGEGWYFLVGMNIFAPSLCSKQMAIEMYRAYLQANAVYQSDPHRTGVVEYVTVMEGTLKISVQDHEYELDSYDTIRFMGNSPHTYINPTNACTVLHFVIAHRLT
ncbi:LOW QUALITY PROTEIN: DNA-binding protein [Geomicrobium sp. JCM 19039]|nr:LOW QUALITY PROTEIN: DNA-binding protein [Geomicrobium sp. JCM 19039]